MFECKKILNGRGNVPEPEVHVASIPVTAGQALVLNGTLGSLSANTAAPTHIAMADAVSGEKVACYAVLPGMIFDVPVSEDPTAIKVGDKLKLDSTTWLKVMATTGGAAIVVNTNGATKAGDIIQVKF